MEATEALIGSVQSEIERVERKIEAVEGELRQVDPSDPLALQYWRKEKEQLRRKEEQLRTKEEQLRKERSETPAFLAPEFVSLLKKGGINAPSEMVIAKIMASFFSEMRANMHSVKAAVELYIHIKELPSTLTISVVLGQAGILIMGPLSSDKPKLLKGQRPDGTAIVVKLLLADMEDARPLEVRLAEIEQEANCCRDLAFADESIALVPYEVVVLEVPVELVRQTTRSGNFKALLMPRYVDSLAQCGVNYKDRVAREAPRMISALKYMHSQGYVHMDVKGDNVFVDLKGKWLLGDFGSACRIGEPIRTSTSVFYHKKMDRDALPKYDWFMLLVMLLIELEDKNRWMFRLMVISEQFVSYDLVMQHADSAASDEALPPDLRAAIAEVKDLYLSALP